MARIKQPISEAVDAFRNTLTTPSQKASLDVLVGLIGSPRDDLGWHHEVGQGITALIAAEGGRAPGRFDRLSAALGPSPSMLRKAARFAALYHSEARLGVLSEMNADWTRLELTFPIEDERKRHDLLRKALEERWSISHLRFEVQRRFRSRRGGVGGRPRTRLAPHGPEVTLRELERLSRRWTDFYEEAFSLLKPKDWDAFERRCRGTEGERLRELVRDAAESLRKMAGRCAKAQRQIKELLQAIP